MYGYLCICCGCVVFAWCIYGLTAVYVWELLICSVCAAYVWCNHTYYITLNVTCIDIYVRGAVCCSVL